MQKVFQLFLYNYVVGYEELGCLAARSTEEAKKKAVKKYGFEREAWRIEACQLQEKEAFKLQLK